MTPPPARDAALRVDADLTAGVMDDLVASSGGKLVRGDDAPCAGDVRRPHFYKYTPDGDGPFVQKLFERCDAIGPHRGQNIANWCCPATPATGADACVRDADCTRGFHAADLSSASDCGCRVCPVVPQTHAASKRRDEQYGRLCTPHVTASGALPAASLRGRRSATSACASRLTGNDG